MLRKAPDLLRSTKGSILTNRDKNEWGYRRKNMGAILDLWFNERHNNDNVGHP